MHSSKVKYSCLVAGLLFALSPFSLIADESATTSKPDAKQVERKEHMEQKEKRQEKRKEMKEKRKEKQEKRKQRQQEHKQHKEEHKGAIKDNGPEHY